MTRRISMKAMICLFATVVFLGLAAYAKLSPRLQFADPSFDARVTNPAYTASHPTVLIDEAHNNFHTAGGRYKPFADLIANDGYQVFPGKQKFDPNTLKGFDILVIANALGTWWPFLPGSDKAAFTEEECNAVQNWVNSGGALLLVADHAPAGKAASNLSDRFGVNMAGGYTGDDEYYDKEARDDSWIIYTRENGTLLDHPITEGRNNSERVNRVTTFMGQSLKGPEGGVGFLKLSEKSFDVLKGQPCCPSAVGRAQGVALKFGKGRVVVLAEAAMLTAQLTDNGRIKFGMQREGNDDRQLALNIMHWLSGLLADK